MSVYSFSQRISSKFKFNKSLLFMAVDALITTAKKDGGCICALLKLYLIISNIRWNKKKKIYP